MSRQLIALVGKKGSGKGVVANHLAMRHHFFHEKFANPLKDMVRVFLENAGIEWRNIEDMIEGDLKEKEIPGIGVTPRHLMQTLGTEWGRECVDLDIWLTLAEKNIESYGDKSVCVDDCRFLNEAQIIRDLGGIIVKIERESVDDTQDAHKSEMEMDSIRPDFTIINDCSLEELGNRVDDLISSLKMWEKLDELTGETLHG